MKPTNNQLNNFKETIFTTITALATKHQAINLGQGFPDFDGPDWIKNHAQEYIRQGFNQYAPGHGVLSLRETLSAMYEKRYGLSYNPQTEITITCGATEAIFCSILALCNPGDEVIVFEPFYDSYIASIELAQAKAVPVTLEAARGFGFDPVKLKQAFSPKTKAILINSPHNPTGRVFTREEIEEIAALARSHQVYVISDEVYEFLTFPGHVHRPSAKAGNIFEQTITISSAGKSFGLTGWKIGWVCAPRALSHLIRMVHQFTTFCQPQAPQLAIMQAIIGLDRYLVDFQKLYEGKRKMFVQGLLDLGLKPYPTEGTYFSLLPLDHITTFDDVGFCRELIERDKVASIPLSGFYLLSQEGKNLVRFCFAKKDETLMNALANLKKRRWS